MASIDTRSFNVTGFSSVYAKIWKEQSLPPPLQPFGSDITVCITPADTHIRDLASGGAGGTLCPPHYYVPLRIFRPCDGPAYNFLNPINQKLMILSSTLDVPSVPSEQRWSLPRREHVSCAEDPSGASNTFAMSYLGSDFVFKTFSQSYQIFPHERN